MKSLKYENCRMLTALTKSTLRNRKFRLPALRFSAMLRRAPNYVLCGEISAQDPNRVVIQQECCIITIGASSFSPVFSDVFSPSRVLNSHETLCYKRNSVQTSTIG